MKRAAAAIALLGVCLSVSNAEEYLVTFQALITDGKDNAFEQTLPATVEMSFIIDTSIAPMKVWQPPPYRADYFGYDAVAFSEFNPPSFGIKTWGLDSVVAGLRFWPHRPLSGVRADVWFDQPLADGITPNASMGFEDHDGRLSLSSSGVHIEDGRKEGGGFAIGESLLVEVTLVPEPSTGAILLSGACILMAFYFARKRRAENPA